MTRQVRQIQVNEASEQQEMRRHRRFTCLQNNQYVWYDIIWYKTPKQACKTSKHVFSIIALLMIQCFASSSPDIWLFGEPGLLLKSVKISFLKFRNSPSFQEQRPRYSGSVIDVVNVFNFLLQINMWCSLWLRGHRGSPGSRDAFVYSHMQYKFS